MEEAQAKYEVAKENADIVGGLAQFSGYTAIDLARFPLDEVFELKDAPGDTAVYTFLENFNKATGNNEPWTPRKLGETMALGGFHPLPVGTAEVVADEFEKWIDEADVDGFNIAYITTPGSQEDVVELLVPELMKRGLMWTDYPVDGGSLRENLNEAPGQKELSKDHYGHKFKWGSGYEGESIENYRAEQAAAAAEAEKATTAEVEKATTTEAGPTATAEVEKATANGEVESTGPTEAQPVSAQTVPVVEKNPETTSTVVPTATPVAQAAA
jgi:hypothetical protein